MGLLRIVLLLALWLVLAPLWVPIAAVLLSWEIARAVVELLREEVTKID